MGKLKSSVQIMKQQLEASKEAEREANPAAAAQEAAALERAERAREEAQRLPDDIRLVLVKEITERFNAEKDSGKKVKQYIADLKEEIAIAVE